MNETDKAVIRDILDGFGIDVTWFVCIGLLHIDDARTWLIRKAFEQRRRRYLRGESDENIEYIKEDLSVRYGVSFSKVEKIVYQR
ncbi:MAG: hypothetical protein K0B37_14670 [Bacteroidales bacterium]|nr:hypothetical protein [Bacteroidales bacterium]